MVSNPVNTIQQYPCRPHELARVRTAKKSVAHFCQRLERIFKPSCSNVQLSALGPIFQHNERRIFLETFFVALHPLLIRLYDCTDERLPFFLGKTVLYEDPDQGM